MTLLPLHLVVNWPVFTRATLAKAGISCLRVSVRPSVRLSQDGILLKRLIV